MKKEEKQIIANKLKSYVSRFDSQNKASNTLKGVSSATISQVLNSKWELISDEMWRTINSQLDGSEEWQIVQTRDFNMMSKLLLDSQENSLVYAVVGEAGSGKSEAIKQYTKTYKRAYMLRCSEFWNRKYFLSELLQAMGRDSSGLTVAEMMQEVISTLLKQDKPLIALDEVDKLTDQVLYFFITIYNELEDRCGIIMCATDHLAKRIKKGVKLNKKGYKEIYSRIGRQFIELNGVGYTDVIQVCNANGITSTSDIKSIYKNCEDDLRRVKRKIHAFKKLQNQTAT